MIEAPTAATLSRSEVLRSSPVQATGWAYPAIGLAIAGMVTWGFWRSYFGPLIGGGVTRPWIIHVHAAVFVGWVVLFVTQASLAAFGRIAFHRRLGRVGSSYGAQSRRT